jgi:predicted MFS family arabinose efflux permease
MPSDRIDRPFAVFAAFASAYFLSALLRAIPATLAPTMIEEFGLGARDLGLLAGAYFLGFILTQLPLGNWLDRSGPRGVEMLFLAIAVIGSVAFASAHSFVALFCARLLCGVGLSACLMAPLTGYRRWFSPQGQTRANSWMLMAGAAGMVASTFPIQWLLPITGWRLLFVALAVLLCLSMALIAALAPRWAGPGGPAIQVPASQWHAYAEIWRNAHFRRMAPIGFVCYGGMVAMQTLWAGPWMTDVAAYSASQAAIGLFWLNVAMLATYWFWGATSPWFAHHGFPPVRLIRWLLPWNFVALAVLAIAGAHARYWTAPLWTLFCATSSVGTMAQPAVALAMRSELAGRALSAYNLVVFAGVFVVQWGIGLTVDVLRARGLTREGAYQGALSLFALAGIVAYFHFLRAKKT